jgi:hypothetical protein
MAGFSQPYNRRMSPLGALSQAWVSAEASLPLGAKKTQLLG